MPPKEVPGTGPDSYRDEPARPTLDIFRASDHIILLNNYGKGKGRM